MFQAIDRFIRKYKIVLIVIIFGSLGTCAYNSFFVQKKDKYLAANRNKSIDDIHSNNVTTPAVLGFVLNAVPVLHIAGLAIDTVIVYSSFEDTVMSDGAVLERDLNCPGLLQNEDYELFFAWQDGHGNEIKRDLSDIYDVKSNADDLIIAARAKVTRLARDKLEKKIGMKVAGKIGAKLTGKVLAKIFLGFAPIIGAASAGGINYYILGNLHRSSINYFREKAKIVCRA